MELTPNLSEQRETLERLRDEMGQAKALYEGAKDLYENAKKKHEHMNAALWLTKTRREAEVFDALLHNYTLAVEHLTDYLTLHIPLVHTKA